VDWVGGVGDWGHVDETTIIAYCLECVLSLDWDVKIASNVLDIKIRIYFWRAKLCDQFGLYNFQWRSDVVFDVVGPICD